MPPSITSPARDQFAAVVVVNTSLCREHYRLTLSLPNTFPTTMPGQFVQIACRDLEEAVTDGCEVDWRPGMRLDEGSVELASPVAMLRRPFSLAGRRDFSHRIEIDIIHRVVGIGTAWLANLRPGDGVSVLGPLGNTFRLPATEQRALLVGGGVGIPPMIYLAEALGKAKREGIAFCGALTRDLLPLTLTEEPGIGGEASLCIEEFARHGIPAVVTSDDGSVGAEGFVTQALERYLDAHAQTPLPVIYTCGPELMMKRVAKIAADRGIECQVAVERAMACGMGTCQSCCIRVKKPDPAKPPLAGSEWCYRLACTDGPIFRGADLLW